MFKSASINKFLNDMNILIELGMNILPPLYFLISYFWQLKNNIHQNFQGRRNTSSDIKCSDGYYKSVKLLR